MQICSWNIVSLRSALKKGFVEKLIALNSDIVCLQETKLNDPFDDRVAPLLYPYQYYHNCTAKKGYAGTAILSKIKPLKVIRGIEHFEENEGRVITLEFNDFYLVNTYVPNAGTNLKRLEWKLNWLKHFFNLLNTLKSTKNVIVTGDLNISHQPIDLAKPQTNQKSAGFSIEERTAFGQFLNIPPLPVTTKKRTAIEEPIAKKVKLQDGSLSKTNEWIDVYRYLYPYKQEFTYYGFRTNGIAKNIGWRLDYFLVTSELITKITKIDIRKDYHGLSDHCPLLMTLE